MKHSISKQEDVVKAIYELLYSHDNSVKTCKYESLDGTIKQDVNLKSIGVALKRIMEIFGYDIISVQ